MIDKEEFDKLFAKNKTEFLEKAEKLAIDYNGSPEKAHLIALTHKVIEIETVMELFFKRISGK